MKNYTIKNEHGQYWTGHCWGVRQAAETFSEDCRLPYCLEDKGEKFYLMNVCEFKYQLYVDNKTDETRASLEQIR